jgi:hypothetical protein
VRPFDEEERLPIAANARVRIAKRLSPTDDLWSIAEAVHHVAQLSEAREGWRRRDRKVAPK